MSGIIVVFPNKDNAANIRNLLTRGGINVRGVCTTGAKALQYAEDAEEGIVVCGYKLVDMMYTDLREYLPSTFEMLLIASPDKWSAGDIEGIVGLSMPIKVYDLLNTVEMMLRTQQRRRRKRREEAKNRNPAQRAVIEQAKRLLMDRNNLTEEEAHRYLQKNSMDSGTNMIETAQMVLTIMGE